MKEEMKKKTKKIDLGFDRFSHTKFFFSKNDVSPDSKIFQTNEKNSSFFLFSVFVQSPLVSLFLFFCLALERTKKEKKRGRERGIMRDDCSNSNLLASLFLFH